MGQRLLQLLCSVVAVIGIQGTFRRVCYYSGWAVNRPPPNNLDAQNIDADLCTHLVFAFAGLESNTTLLKAASKQDQMMYSSFTNLKQKNPQLKTMLAVGGWTIRSAPFTYLVQSQAHMYQFANNTVRFLRNNNFDGVDIDWEYPGDRGSPPEDKRRFSQLLQILRSTFEHEPNRGSKEKLLLSVAVGGGEERANKSYEIQEISRYADFVNMMMYDFHGSWEETSLVNHHSSLYSNDELNVDKLAEYWATHGATKSKLNVGVPFYGRNYTLVDPTQTGVGASHTGGGYMPYFEICALIKARNVTEHMLPTERVPYIVSGDQWVGYDNPQSVIEKVEYIKTHNYGGIMVWAIDMDDTSGACGHGPYPLMNAARNTFRGLNPGIIG